MFQFNFDNLKTITIGNNNIDIKFSVQDTNNPHNQKMENTNNLKGFGQQVNKRNKTGSTKSENYYEVTSI